jgi:cardiolipin synthase
MRRLLIAVVAGLLVALVGCKGVAVDLSAPTSKAKSGTSAKAGTTAKSGTSTVPVQPAVGSGTLRLLVEPAAGVEPIYKLIAGAKSSIDLTIYTLRDQTAESDLAAAAARGVDVRVILDQHFERSENTATYSYLSKHHVHMTWAPKGTTYHQKTLTVDNKTSAVMTLNLVSEDYSSTRDFAFIDTDHADVAAIVATFNADFAHKAITPPDGADLAWSPTNSQDSILAVIDVAKHTLSVENEEMGDATITDALEAAARRGVDVKVVMTADSEWDDSFNDLVKAGVHVHLFKDSVKALYIHAKAVVADVGRSDQQVFAGSENFSVASLRRNRELGIRTANRPIISAISSTIATDYANSAAYSAS